MSWYERQAWRFSGNDTTQEMMVESGRLRMLSLLAVAGVVAVGCATSAPSGEPGASAIVQSPVATALVSPAGSEAAAFLGTWHRDQTCAETAALFESMDLRRLGADYLIGLGFRTGTVDDVSADADMCIDASEPLSRTLFFEPDLHWGGLIGAEQVDDGKITDLDENSFVIPGDDTSPPITVSYAVEGSTITFAVEEPQPCSESACIEQFAWARETFALGPWERM